MADKKQDAPKAPAQQVVVNQQAPAIDESNPATDPNVTAQERLDALTKQQEATRQAE